MPNGWQPAILADREHVLRFHTLDPGAVSKYAGERIRVRKNSEAHRQVALDCEMRLGCVGEHVEVHPEDAARLWPDMVDHYGVTVCTCQLLMD